MHYKEFKKIFEEKTSTQFQTKQFGVWLLNNPENGNVYPIRINRNAPRLPKGNLDAMAAIDYGVGQGANTGIQRLGLNRGNMTQFTAQLMGQTDNKAEAVSLQNQIHTQNPNSTLGRIGGRDLGFNEFELLKKEYQGKIISSSSGAAWIDADLVDAEPEKFEKYLAADEQGNIPTVKNYLKLSVAYQE